MSKRTTCYFVNGKLVVESPKQGVFNTGLKEPVIESTQETPKKISRKLTRPVTHQETKQVAHKLPDNLSTDELQEKLDKHIGPKQENGSATKQYGETDYSQRSTFALEASLRSAYLDSTISGFAQKRYEELLAEYKSRPLEERQAARKNVTQAMKGRGTS